MKSAFVSLVLAFGLAAAQLGQLGSIPPCAYTCVTSFVSGNSIANCKAADIACVCRNSTFIGDISCCLGGKAGCSQADIESTINFAVSLCAANDVQVPTALACSTSLSSTGSTSSSQTQSGSSVTTGSSSTTQAPSSTGPSVTTTPSSTSSKAAGAQVVGNAGGIIGAALAIVAAL